MNESLQKKISNLAGLIATQRDCISPGHPSAQYMHGMANGMILGLAILTDSSPDYVKMPRRRRGRNNIRHKTLVRKGRRR